MRARVLKRVNHGIYGALLGGMFVVWVGPLTIADYFRGPFNPVMDTFLAILDKIDNYYEGKV